MQNVKPKKKLGQHFLIDANIARKIAQLLPAQADDAVVEIGPGTGMLTQHLLIRWPHLVAVEFDAEAAGYLEEHYPMLKIVNGDFLEQDLSNLLPNPGWYIGNLPYNISSPIFFHFLESLSQVKGGVFMVQKEVAERICSKHGNKTYGILSVLLGSYFHLKYEFSVSEKVFFPRPRVQSAVFSLLRKPSENETPYPLLHKVVKAAFGQRRKTLRNALGALNEDLSRVPDSFLSSRAEQLSIEQFAELARFIYPV